MTDVWDAFQKVPLLSLQPRCNQAWLWLEKMYLKNVFYHCYFMIISCSRLCMHIFSLLIACSLVSLKSVRNK